MAFVNALDPTLPLGSDPVSQGDDQIRLVKAALIERIDSFFTGHDVQPWQAKSGSGAATLWVVSDATEAISRLAYTGAGSRTLEHFANVTQAGWRDVTGVQTLVAYTYSSALLVVSTSGAMQLRVGVGQTITTIVNGVTVGTWSASGLVVGGTISQLGAAGGNVTVIVGATAPAADNSGTIELRNTNVSHNWQIGNNNLTGDALTITPSTVGGGSTYTTSLVTLRPTAAVVGTDPGGTDILRVGSNTNPTMRVAPPNGVTANGVLSIGSGGGAVDPQLVFMQDGVMKHNIDANAGGTFFVSVLSQYILRTIGGAQRYLCDSTGNHIFGTDPGGTLLVRIGGGAAIAGLLDLSLTGAGQVKFAATQNASADANTLDDYKEGTWTPSVGGTATYTTQVGTYVKIGRLLYASFKIVINAIGTGSTSVVSGLPYTDGSGTISGGGFTFFSGLTTAVVFLTPGLAASGTAFTIFGMTAAATGLSTIGVLQNGARIEGYVVYYANT